MSTPIGQVGPPPFIAAAVAVLGSPEELDKFVAAVAATGAPTLAALINPDLELFAIDGTLMINGSTVTLEQIDERIGSTDNETALTVLTTLLRVATGPAALAALAQAQLYAALRATPSTRDFLNHVRALPSPGVNEVVALMTPPHASQHAIPPVALVVAAVLAAIAIAVGLIVSLGDDDAPSAATPTTSEVQTTTPSSSSNSTTTESESSPTETTSIETTMVEGNVRFTAGATTCVAFNGALLCDVSGLYSTSDISGCAETGGVSSGTTAEGGVSIKWTPDKTTCVTPPSNLPSLDERHTLSDGENVALEVGTDIMLCSYKRSTLTCRQDGDPSDGFTIFETSFRAQP